MNLNGLEITDNTYYYLKNMDDLYSIKNKHVLFIMYQPSLDYARVLTEYFGARMVYYVNPDYEYQKVDGGKIILINSLEVENPQIEEASIDLVLGYEILEHINNLDEFFKEIKRIMKPAADFDVHGNPMWTCNYGHHIWIENKYIFYKESNPFEPWEHLLYENAEEMEKALIAKNISEDDAKEISEFIFNPIEVSRHTPTEIIKAATAFNSDFSEKEQIAKSCFSNDKNSKNNVSADMDDSLCVKSNSQYAAFESYSNDGWICFCKRTLDRTSPNQYFNKALEKYSESDLTTMSINLKLKRDLECESKLEREIIMSIPGMHHAISDITIPFCKLHQIKDADILNLSHYESILLDKMFMALGAKSVTSVSPYIENNNYYINSCVSQHKTYFEDFETGEKKFDIIFGLDSLNKINDIEKFCSKMKDVSKTNTVIYLTGFLSYTSANGHCIVVGNHSFVDETNPLENWQHLSLMTKEDVDKYVSKDKFTPDEISFIKYCLFDRPSVCRLSPTEIENTFNKYLNINMDRIHKFAPKNEYYEKALLKYPEKDLNVERLIVSTDFPTKKEIDSLDMDEGLVHCVCEINSKYNFYNKNVLNIMPYDNNDTSECIAALNVQNVTSLSNYYSGFELSGGKNITKVNQKYEDIENLRDKYDIIFGLDTLEHVSDIKRFFNNVKNLIKDTGLIYLQGSPLWTSDMVHMYIDDLDCGSVKYGYGPGKLEPWEHLGYDTKEEMKDALLKKEFTENDAEKISEYVFNGDNTINHYSYSDFIDELSTIEDVYYGTRKVLHYAEENEFYKKASQKYTHEQLRTKELRLYIRKKLC